MGFPNKKKEDWKFTDLRQDFKFKFRSVNSIKKKAKFKSEKIFDFDHNSITNLNGALIDYDFSKRL